MKTSEMIKTALGSYLSVIPTFNQITERTSDKLRVYARINITCSDWTWFLCSIEKEISDNDALVFGYVKGYVNELGCFNLADIVNTAKKYDAAIVITLLTKPTTLKSIMGTETNENT
jgi:hypothetical protein